MRDRLTANPTRKVVNMDSTNARAQSAIATRRVLISVEVEYAPGKEGAGTIAQSMSEAVEKAAQEGLSRADDEAKIEHASTWVQAVGESQVACANLAALLCIRARELLVEAGATRALKRLRNTIPSIKGAVRAAEYRQNRETRDR